ncbi:MAG: RNA polymerase sigma factor [Ktedonobacterales bacterium]
METPATTGRSGTPAPTVTGASLTLSVEDFSVVLERGQRPLYTFLCGLVGDDEQARDLVQDTFYEAWRVYMENAPPFDVVRPETEVRRWLFRVAYRRAVSALRRRRIVRWHSLEAKQEVERADMPVVEPFEERLAEDDAVRAALAALAPADVACLTLIVVHGFTAAEAGQIVGASAQAVAKRFARAKQRMRAAYLAQNQQTETRHSR